ncbi:MAG: AAA family ATPase [Candidatus Aenigmatarchaeota archaeon]
MPRIERLEMQGFKSFAKKTIIEFPTNFSLICGPNGSGKSNILDSICFVLGRTSAKSMRADRLSQLIYNGDKPAEYAKVSLVLNNSDKIFPLEEEHITISRSINRKGVSIYKLNGNTVTREKIIEILRAGNIHPDGHNIILQGDITEIIEMSPIERREIIDEISGIAEFDEKREKAQKELSVVEERLKEATITLNERFAILKKLEKEKEAAEEFERLSKELDAVRATISKIRLTEAELGMKKLEEIIKEKSKICEELDNEIKEIDKSIEELEKKSSESTKQLIERKDEIELLRQIEQLKSEISRRKDRIEFIKTDNERLVQLKEKLSAFAIDTNPVIKEILKLGWSGIYGTFGSLIQTEEKYKTAIEIAAGQHLNDIVVKDIDTTIECIKYLKSKKIGRATFLPLDKIHPRNDSEVKKYLKENGVIDIAINLVKFDKKYYNAISFVLGDTLIIENIDVAKKIGIGNVRCVTLDGDLIDKSGSIVGGFYSKKKTFESLEIERIEKNINQNNLEMQKIIEEIKIAEEKLNELSKKQIARTSEFDDIQKMRTQTERLLLQLKMKRKELAENQLNISQEIQNFQLKKARLEAELENIKTEFSNFKEAEILKENDIIKLQSIENDLRIKINKLGPINMRAIEEWKKLKESYDEMSSKVNALLEERNKILQVIAEIESQRKNIFMQTLNGIAFHFKKIFKELCGGESNLKLEYYSENTEIQNLNEAGLIIEATPPGKKTLNIDSLSGGEKTLAALAFLFAIQQYKPAQFYVLDEIDAALDKPNSRKIAEIIKKYSETAQFIVISHNDETISAADCVYGVSMFNNQSKIIGIKMP